MGVGRGRDRARAPAMDEPPDPVSLVRSFRVAGRALGDDHALFPADLSAAGARFAAWALIGMVVAAWRARRSDPRMTRRWALAAPDRATGEFFGYTRCSVSASSYSPAPVDGASRLAMVPGVRARRFWPCGSRGDACGNGEHRARSGRAAARVLRPGRCDSAQVLSECLRVDVFSLTFHHVLDPADDAVDELLRVRLWRNDRRRAASWNGRRFSRLFRR